MWGLYTTQRSSLLVSHEITTCKLIACLQSYWKIPEFLGRLDLFIFVCYAEIITAGMYCVSSCTDSQTTIELDWIEEYQWVNLSRYWKAVSGEGWIQKQSHFTRYAVQPSPLYKCNKEKSKMAESWFWNQPSDWTTTLFLYSSFQV